MISRCTTPPTRPKCWITSRTTATFASLLRGVPIHADTPAQPETYRTARPSAGPGLGVEEASWVVDRKSRTAISWPSSQRLRHRAKGRLSLGDLVGRTRSEPPGTTTGTAKASAATMRVEAVCDVDRPRCVSALELQCPLSPCRIPARESMASEWPQPEVRVTRSWNRARAARDSTGTA